MKKGLYRHNNVLYVTIEEVKTYSSTMDRWEKHILYICCDTCEKCSMEIKEFEKRFTKIYGQLKINNGRSNA